MPVIISPELPAAQLLAAEGLPILSDIDFPGYTPGELRIGILNLMPMKEMTECDLLRLISVSPHRIRVDFLETASYRGKNTPASHLDRFYQRWPEVKDRHYDGFIITGAPVEKKEFDEVFYWPELCEIMDWTRRNATTTLYICWAALAGLFHHYGVPKRMLETKISGVFKHRILEPDNRLLRGFDDEFLVPHSRYSEIWRSDIEKAGGLRILTDSERAGIHAVMSENHSEIFITGHSEYSPMTLDFEYRRDCTRGLNPEIPANYYRNDDPDRGEVVVRWRSHANLLFSNWINNFVYNCTTQR